MSKPGPPPISPRHIPVVGIVGGVGSGKSSVAKTLAELVPVAIVEADQLGHRALALPEVKEKLRARFGPAIFDAAGTVIRKELAQHVFGDDTVAQTARADLEAITHPVIHRLARKEIDQQRAKNLVQWIILDAALLLEAGWKTFCDLVVYVDVAPERRLQQVKTQRGWTEDEWRRREASQWPVERKRAAADVAVSNNGTLKEAGEELKRILEDHASEKRR